MARFDLTDFEWSVIQPVLPNKPRGVPRVDNQALELISRVDYALRRNANRRFHGRDTHT